MDGREWRPADPEVTYLDIHTSRHPHIYTSTHLDLNRFMCCRKIHDVSAVLAHLLCVLTSSDWPVLTGL